jgi:hypothetical protein
MITNRFAIYPRTVGPRVKLFINVMVTSPGQVSLWTAIIQYLALKRNTDMYTIQMFIEDFVNGLYSEEQFSTMWNMQKIGGNNMVDSVAHQPELLAAIGEPDENMTLLDWCNSAKKSYNKQ